METRTQTAFNKIKAIWAGTRYGQFVKRWLGESRSDSLKRWEKDGITNQPK